MNNTIKRISCFLLAILMLISVIGCKETKKKKPNKVVVRDKITVVPSNKNEDDSINSDISDNNDNNVDDAITRAKRDLLKKEEEDMMDNKFSPE